jgi:superfamily II RNA helicase
MEAFLDWVLALELELYPAQEEAVLELMAGNHVILNTPTGSGKSMVANAAHFRALCRAERSYYTSPIKALVSEKFFDLCRIFGADQVGMLTGDASINHDASIICCTAEVLANIALQEGELADVASVVMDEFHYYADKERGVAWQVPLLRLPQARFLLMSATLGDTRVFEEEIPRQTKGRALSVVRSTQRPVPLDFQYAEIGLHENIENLVTSDRAPVYVVNFTQRDAAQLAQDLVSLKLISKQQRHEISAEMGGFRFDSAYGKDLKRFLSAGVGLHHAGLLPKYRRLVERLAQKGLLKVVCGTDTLGVGVNIPLRTVLFSKLCKYDGEGTKILSVRDFKQIAGRAGRKGYDDQGWVVCQAPAHVIENKRLEAKARAKGQKKFQRKKPPDRGYVHWEEATYRKLVDGSPEALDSRFRVTQGTILDLLQSPSARKERGGGYGQLVRLIADSYESPGRQKRHRLRAAEQFRALRQAAIVRVERDAGGGSRLELAEGLDTDFSLFHALSLWLVEVLDELDPKDPDYALDMLSMAEAILENPRALLVAQEKTAKTELVTRMKAEGSEYEERMEALDQVSYPKPKAEFIYRHFDGFRARFPWVRTESIRPKGIAREMYESFSAFDAYTKSLGMARAEGLLLRYLNQVYKTLRQNVPEAYKTDSVVDLIAWLAATLERVDASLISEWESLAEAVEELSDDVQLSVPTPVKLTDDPRAFRARVRAELHRVAAALAKEDFIEAAASLLVDEESGDGFTADALAKALVVPRGNKPRLRFDHEARLADKTIIRELGTDLWLAEQHLLPRSEDDVGWLLSVHVDLRDDPTPVGPLLRPRELIADP